jgi:hypothetical protein
MTIRFRHVQREESSGEVIEGLAYPENHQAEVVEFAIKAHRGSAKIYVKIERGSIAINCLDFF